MKTNYQVKKITVFSLAAFLLLSAAVKAQTSIADSLDGRVNTIKTAVPFLRIAPDARSGAMGDVGVGLSPDANSIFWNTAKLPFATNNLSLGVTYTPWLRELVNDIYLASLAGYYKVNKNSALT